MNSILIDGRPLEGGSQFRGIGTYVRELLRGLGETEYGDRIRLLHTSSTGGITDSGNAPSAGSRLPTVKRRLQPLLDPFFMTRILNREKPSLYHSVEYAQPLRSPCPVVITVYDLIPFLYRHWYPWLRRERMLALSQLKHADALLAISDATARDLVRIAHVPEDRITVTPLGVNPRFSPASPLEVDTVRERYGIAKNYLLAVGTFDPRKRIDLLADIVNSVRRESDVELVIVGQQGNFEARVEHEICASGLSSATHLLGHVTEDELIALYSGARCLVFPSEYEGFGLPLLEAMSCGCPAAAFSTSSLPEVASPRTILVPQYQCASMAREICAILDEGAARTAHIEAGIRTAKGFSWTTTVASTIGVYRSLLS